MRTVRTRTVTRISRLGPATETKSDWSEFILKQVSCKQIYSLRHRKCGVRGYIHELFVSKPERARYERVRAFDTNNE